MIKGEPLGIKWYCLLSRGNFYRTVVSTDEKENYWNGYINKFFFYESSEETINTSEGKIEVVNYTDGYVGLQHPSEVKFLKSGGDYYNLTPIAGNLYKIINSYKL